MRRNKQNGGGGGGGDWSDTGTFVRKPATGWLHKDSDLANGAYVKYRLSYLGCAVVLESMRSLQYQARTLVTREAITRLAELGDKIPTRKRKIPKNVAKLLGESNTRWANDVNLCIDVEQLQICSAASQRDIMTHSLTSISFASGGDGSTQDFIGYVAKDPINDRACHVFYCPGGTAQLVLASLGQAFELRYKMYLSSSNVPQPKSQPMAFTTVSPKSIPSQSSFPPPLPDPRGSVQDHSHSPGRFTGHSDSPPSFTETSKESHSPQLLTNTYANQGKKRLLPSEPPPMTEITQQIQAPLPPPPSMPPLSLPSRPRVYSSLPGFPEPEPEELMAIMNHVTPTSEPQYEMNQEYLQQQQQSKNATLTSTNSQKQWTNDPTNSQKTSMVQQDSNRLSYNPYDTMPAGSTLPGNNAGNNNEDDKDHDYDCVEEEEEAMYDVVEGYEDESGNVVEQPPNNDTIDFHEPDHLAGQLQNQPPPQGEEEYQLITIHQKPSIDIEDQIDLTPAQTPDMLNHVYSNLQEELPMSPQQQIGADYDDPESLEMPALLQKPTEKGEYDDPDAFLQASFNSMDCPPPPYPGLAPPNKTPVTKQSSPAFDDSIYSTPQSEFSEPEVNPLAPLHMQPYFHGRIARPDAEALVKNDGDFLVRESANKPGQYVLTGLSNGRSQHLLLIDKSGKVKSRDREFESVPHLVKFFYERATSLTIGNCEVFLSRPISV